MLKIYELIKNLKEGQKIPSEVSNLSLNDISLLTQNFGFSIYGDSGVNRISFQ